MGAMGEGKINIREREKIGKEKESTWEKKIMEEEAIPSYSSFDEIENLK